MLSWPWVLQLDVAHCFPTILHAPLLALMLRRLRGSAFGLLAHIVACHGGEQGRGLPIGSLTSQHLANQYLGEIDRAAIAHPATRAHVRYMDDVLLWCDSAAQARALRDHLADWLPRALGLQFKPPRIQRSSHGLAFCGFRLRADGLRLGRRRQRAWRQGWQTLQQAEAAGLASEAGLQQRAEVLHALALPSSGPIRAWCRQVMVGRPAAPPHAADAAGRGRGDRAGGPAVCSTPADTHYTPTEPPAGAARRQLERHRQELPVSQPQRERAG
jgi:RNA-directed DNA polymerase